MTTYKLVNIGATNIPANYVIKTEDGKLVNFQAQVDAVLESLVFITSFRHKSLGFKWVDNGDGTGRFKETDES